jgi:arylsulfatase A-like enzyme
MNKLKVSALLIISIMGLQTLKSQTKPNIIILFVDDLGWADVQFRNQKFDTPNINKLKLDGLNFERAYVSTPTCSPSRASLLTGKEPVRFQMVRHILDDDETNSGSVNGNYNLWKNDPVQMTSRQFLPLEEVTYAERLKDLGYYNAFFGKWHLGKPQYYPIYQGFDQQTGVTSYGHPKTFYYPFFKANNPFNNSKEKDYLTDLLTDSVTHFIKNYNKPHPFELSLYFYNVHSPFVGRVDLIEKYKKAGLNLEEATYAAKITAVDESIGKVRKSLMDKGIDKNTVIIFISDQGGFYSNAPLSGGKIGNTLGEGGSRIPMIVYYPGLTKANTTTSIPVQTIDIFPTLIEIASGNKCKDKQVNGISLLPILKGKNIKSRKLYFFRSYEDQYASIIDGDWKLVKYHSGEYHLFNVTRDISEAIDLKVQDPKKAEYLLHALSKWEKSVITKN